MRTHVWYRFEDIEGTRVPNDGNIKEIELRNAVLTRFVSTRGQLKIFLFYHQNLEVNTFNCSWVNYRQIFIRQSSHKKKFQNLIFSYRVALPELYSLYIDSAALSELFIKYACAATKGSLAEKIRDHGGPRLFSVSAASVSLVLWSVICCWKNLVAPVLSLLSFCFLCLRYRGFVFELGMIDW